MSSIEPDCSSGEVNCGKKIDSGFVVTRGDSAELLEAAEEILDQVALFVEGFVVDALVESAALGRDDRGLSRRRQRANHADIGIEGFVGDQNVGDHARQKGVGSVQIVSLAWCEEKLQRISHSINQRVDFGAQAPFASPDRLVRAVFLSAPALC